MRKPISRKRHLRTCELCQRQFATEKPQQRFCSVQCSTAIGSFCRIHTCENCGKTFHRTHHSSRDALRFCSRECGGTAKNQFAWRAIADGAVKVLHLYMRQIEKETRQSQKALCTGCGRQKKSMISGRCSRCIERGNRGIVGCARCGLDITLPLTTNGTQPRICGECELQSMKKARKIMKKKRNALKRGNKAEAVDPVSIFNRDNWTCQRCGKHCTSHKTYHPDNATLDHILPLSRGGPHIESNLQTMCHLCNAQKGNRMEHVL